MRRVQKGVWGAAVLLASAAPAVSQAIVEPNGPGRTVPTNAVVGTFRETVYTTGDVSLCLRVYHNTTLKFSAGATVLTTGPSFTVSCDVPLWKFGLVAGDRLTFAFSVRHLNGCDSGTASHVASVIPVVVPCGNGGTTGGDGTTTRRSSAGPPDEILAGAPGFRGAPPAGRPEPPALQVLRARRERAFTASA